MAARVEGTDRTMAARLPGEVSRRPGWWHLALVAGALALALPAAAIAASSHAKKPAKPKPAAAAAATASAAPRISPLPVLSPQHGAAAAVVATQKTTAVASASSAGDTAASADAIGALIAAGDTGEQKATEDSDAPEATPVRPDLSQDLPPVAPPPSAPTGGSGLQLAVSYLDKNDPADAMASAYALPDKIDIKLVDWLIATGGYAGVPSSSVATLQKSVADWPNQGLIRLRFEQALKREQPDAATIIKALGGGTPISDDGKILLAGAYLGNGRTADAAAIIQPFWRDGDFSQATETTIVTKFGSLLQAADHKARMDRLLYAEQTAAAVRAAGHLDKDQQALAKAVVLVIKNSSKALAALNALPAAVKRDPMWLYGEIEALRSAGKNEDAGRLLLSAPRDAKVLEDPDAWWVERRLVSRSLVTAGDATLAYQIAAGHSGESPALKAEAEFHAGWYALEYLHDPATAQVHFANIAAISTMPLSVSRAEYWLGRAADAARNNAVAMTHYQRAASFPTTFYGQLAIARLGGSALRLAPPPAPTAADRATFATRDMVIAIQHLDAVGYNDRTGAFYRTLADTLTSPGEIALLAAMAEADGNHQLALQIGKTAASRGLPVDALAFPTTAIPSAAATPDVDRAVVFAVARQESAFNPGAVSAAGARGLMQLMPATARITAKTIGVPYSLPRLTSDPGYNATLGAAHLGSLIDDFGGSYVMTFAAYNAGTSRVNQWVQQFGDPRDPKVDVVNWIESIPFTETRNYVQRLMENLEVYHARLGAPTLTIESDLKRGHAD